MKIVIATDSYKHCLSSQDAGRYLMRGLRAAQPGAELVVVPVADGGEGTVSALVDATGGSYHSSKVTGPLKDKVDARWGMLGDEKTAVIEMAAASGIELVPENRLNPLKTTTYGTGELIREALDKGAKKIIVGLGGSSTNDGGAGMFQALGGSLKGKDGKQTGAGGGALSEVEGISFKGLDNRLKDCEIHAASDVSNPLTGPEGASLVYGPQKGADEETAELLDKNLKKFADLVKTHTGNDLAGREGAGAAGGLGYGLMALLGAKLSSGFEIISKIVNLENEMKGADLVITGEGKIDGQTRFGKTPKGVADIASKMDIPVIGVAGTLGEGYENLYDAGFTALFSIADKPMDLEEALKRAPGLLYNTGYNLGKSIGIIFS
jgi:glycerate kinase